MKKSTFLTGGLLALACCGLVFAKAAIGSDNRGVPAVKVEKNTNLISSTSSIGTLNHAKHHDTSQTPPSRVKAHASSQAVDMLWTSLIYTTDTKNAYSFNDIFETVPPEISFYIPDTSILIFTGVERDFSNNQLYTAWYSPGTEAIFYYKGSLRSESYDIGQNTANITISFYGVGSNNEWIPIGNSQTIDLNESNSFYSDFSISISGIPQYATIGVGYVVNSYVDGVESAITISNQELYYEISTDPSTGSWTETEDEIGLGFNSYYGIENFHAVEIDSDLTFGAYLDPYNGSVYITGMRTNATDVTIPSEVTIDGQTYPVAGFGIDYVADWRGAENVTTLRMDDLSKFYVSTLPQTITDVYINQDNFGSWYNRDFPGTYLHLPYSMARYRHSYEYFKRVFVGEETEDYPEPGIASWVIAGDEEGDYFGICVEGDRFGNPSSYSVSEVYTDKEEITLPSVTPYDNNEEYEITRIGWNNDDHCFANAPNLTTVTLPASYESMHINWATSDNEHVKILHIYGNVTQNGYAYVLPDMTIYVENSEYFYDYSTDGTWNQATILPGEWANEWLTIDVTRKGEFAQRYIELTDGNWNAATNVKVTGTLNSADLKNIRNIGTLMRLDLSEAEFDEIPESFMEFHTIITEVILPNELHSLPRYAFQGCSNLTTLDVSKVTYFSDYCLYGCDKFNPELSSNVTYIGMGAFSRTRISTLELSNDIIEIGPGAFSSCKNLSKVVIPESITTINSSTFYNCSNLTEVTLPEGLTLIAGDAFNSCISLREITLPSTLEEIRIGTFAYCTSLTSVKCKAVVPPSADGGFTDGIDMNHCTLYVAPFTISAYREDMVWSNFFIMKPLDEPIKNIYVNRPVLFDLLSEDNAVLQGNPNITLDYDYDFYGYYNSEKIGQITAMGDGTLSAGHFSINHYINSRDGYMSPYTTLINDAENMRADEVTTTLRLEKDRWHFISFRYDVNMSDIIGVNGTDFAIRQYNSEKRASIENNGNNWEDVPADGVLHAEQGYIIQAANNTPIVDGYGTYDAEISFPSGNTVTKNILFASQDVTVTLKEYPSDFAHNRSWNLIGNPYPCFYDLQYLKNDFTTPVVIWRGGNYQAYSPVDDHVILRPNEAFFVQCPIDNNEMSFSTDGRMHWAEAYYSSATPGVFAPAQMDNAAERSVFNFVISGKHGDDRARIVMNDNASADYEISRDAAKFFAENGNALEIFVNSGIAYDICERPLAEGIATLGINVAEEGEYTLSLNGRAIKGWSVMLTDNVAGTTVNLSSGDYAFDAAEGYDAERFTLTFKAPESTSIDDIAASLADVDVAVYDMSGILTYQGKFDSFRAEANEGVYIVIASDKAYKIAVK